MFYILVLKTDKNLLKYNILNNIYIYIYIYIFYKTIFYKTIHKIIQSKDERTIKRIQ